MYKSYETNPTRTRKAKAPVDFGGIKYYFFVAISRHNDSIENSYAEKTIHVVDWNHERGGKPAFFAECRPSEACHETLKVEMWATVVPGETLYPVALRMFCP